MLGILCSLLCATTSWAALPAGLDPAETPAAEAREAAVGTLARHPEATATLIAVLHEDPALEVRLRAARALFARWAAGVGDRETYRNVAVWAATYADEEIRAEAVLALAESGDNPALFLPYLEDDSDVVRAAAASACERWIDRFPRARVCRDGEASRSSGPRVTDRVARTAAQAS